MRYVFYFILTLSGLCLLAQPKWANKRPTSVSGKFYYFEGQGNTKKDAYLDAIHSMAQEIGFIKVIGSTEKTVRITDDYRDEIYESITQVDAGNKTFNVFPVAYEKRGNLHYVLIGTPNEDQPTTSRGGVMGKQPFILRSIIPGWSQFYNTEVKKGIFFSIGEVALIGATLFSFDQSSDQKDQANLALLNGNLAQYNSFDQKSNQWSTTGTILGIGAISLWVLNIIDASTSEKHLYVFNDGRMHLDLVAGNHAIGIKVGF